MKWFYLVLLAAAVAAAAIALGRLTHVFGRTTIKMIVAASIVVLFVALIEFLTKLHD